VEGKVRKALEELGCHIQVSTELDLRYKVDMLIVQMDNQKIDGGIGLQVTTKRDPHLVKARIAKLNALKVCRYFVFLIINTRRLNAPFLADCLKALFLKRLLHPAQKKALVIRWDGDGLLTVKNL